MSGFIKGFIDVFNSEILGQFTAVVLVLFLFISGCLFVLYHLSKLGEDL